MHPTTRVLALATSAAAAACTTMGPTPATMGVAAMPAARPDVTVTAAVTPGYFLSAATAASGGGDVFPSGSLTFEPDRLLQVPGLIVGVTNLAMGDGGTIEPMIGYRRRVAGAIPGAWGVMASATHADDHRDHASYDATRASLEAMGEVQLGGNRWAEVLLTGTLQATAMAASGTYCSTDDGHGADCGDAVPDTTADVAGLFVSGTAGLALAIGRNTDTWFHGLRLGLTGAAGSMPTVIHGEQEPVRVYGSVGLNLGMSVGAAR